MPKMAVVLTLLAKHALAIVTVDGAVLLPLVATVLVKAQTMEYVMENLGFTILETTQILALTVLPSVTANLAFIMTPIACGAVQLKLAKNGVLL